MADVTPWAVITGFAGSVLVGVLAFLGTKRTAQTTEKVGLTTAQVTGQTATEKLLFEELKRVQERGDKLEADFRHEIKDLQGQINILNTKVLTLEIEKANLLTDHARKEREWEGRLSDLQEENKDLKATLLVKEKRIDTLLGTQIGLMEHIKQYSSQPYILPPESELIGDSEYAVAQDMFTQRSRQHGKDSKPSGQ